MAVVEDIISADVVDVAAGAAGVVVTDTAVVVVVDVLALPQP